MGEVGSDGRMAAAGDRGHAQGNGRSDSRPADGYRVFGASTPHTESETGTDRQLDVDEMSSTMLVDAPFHSIRSIISIFITC